MSKKKYKDLREAMLALQESKDAVAGQINEQAGETVITEADGLRDMADKLDTTVLDDDASAVVTAAQRIYKGDTVALTRELIRDGAPLRVAYEGAKLLAVDSSCMVDDLNKDKPTVIVWCFSQNGGVYLKTACRNRMLDTGWSLGATVFVGELASDRVSLTYVRDTLNGASGAMEEYVVLLYKDGDTGMGIRYKLNGLALSEPLSFNWADVAPRNFAACWAPAKDWTAEHSERADYYGFVSVAHLMPDGNIALTAIRAEDGALFRTILLPPGRHETAPWRGRTWTYSVAAPMDEEYANAAWHLQCQRTHGACYLTYPGADGKRYVLEYLSRFYQETVTNEDGSQETVTRVEAWPYGGTVMICDGYVPCGSGLSNLDGRETYVYNRHEPTLSVELDIATMPWLVGVISRTAGQAQKSSLGIERFLGGKQHFLAPLGWIETADNPRQNMGLLSCCRCGAYKSNMAIGYESEGKYRGCIVYLLGDHPESPLMCFSVGMPLIQEPVCGPDVELADVGTEATLVECDRDPALIYQREGSIYLQRLSIQAVAAPTKIAKYAGAVAVTGGSPGQTIKIATLRVGGPEPQDRSEQTEEG